MQLPTQVQLTECGSGLTEGASIVSLDRETAKTQIDAIWWQDLQHCLTRPEDEPDRHWRWRELVSRYQNKPNFRALCVRSMDGNIQAAVLLRLDAASAIELGERAVFIDRLASAPQNRAHLVLHPQFRGAGTALVTYAVAFSRSLGFGGRVNLCVTGSEAFYLSFGFVPTSITYMDDIVFELPAVVANQRLIEEGLSDD